MNTLHNRRCLKQTRKDLRSDLTPAEATLWRLLQKKQLAGRKFRRQHSVGNYILDFYPNVTYMLSFLFLPIVEMPHLSTKGSTQRSSTHSYTMLRI